MQAAIVFSRYDNWCVKFYISFFLSQVMDLTYSPVYGWYDNDDDK